MLDFTKQQLCCSTPSDRNPVWFGSTWSLDRVDKLDLLCLCANDPIPDLPTTKSEQMYEIGTNVGEHATCIVGFKQHSESIDFLIQNSHGIGHTPGKGHIIMTQEWFEHYGYVVVISRDILKQAYGDRALHNTKTIESWEFSSVA